MAEADQNSENQAMQPGQVIAPGGQSASAPEPPMAPDQPTVMEEPPAVAPPPVEQSANADPAQTPKITDSGQTISWTASEFVAHQKTKAWYGQLTIATLLLAGLIYLVTRDLISTIVIVIVGAIFGMSAGRQPRELDYQVSPKGVMVGPKLYGFEKFRSFSVDEESAFASINFMPLKRFAPPLTIYLAPDQEQAVVDVLSSILPTIEHRHDMVDRLMNRIHF